MALRSTAGQEVGRYLSPGTWRASGREKDERAVTHFGRKNQSDWQQPLLVSVQCREHRGDCGKPPERADCLPRS